MPLDFLSCSEEQTVALAKGIAQLLESGDVVLLHGQLGAGKTFFIRAAARELGVTAPVTSPSFTMAQSYAGRLPVHHLDLYRLERFGVDDAVDFEPYFSQEAISFVEWPDAAEDFIGQPALVIDLGHVNEHSRSFSFACGRERLRRELKRLIADLSL